MSHHLPHVHIVCASQPRQCTTYLLKGDGGSVLIDPGSGAFEAEVLDGIRAAGVEPDAIRHVLLTHYHYDHTLGAGGFRDRGMRLVAHPRTAEVLRQGGRRVWVEYPDYVIPTEVDVTPADGEVMTLAGMAVRVLHTPGHTDGCASYLVDTDEGLTAFTGDLLCCETRDDWTVSHVGWAGDETFSVEASLASIEKLLAWAPDRACSGHGPVEGPAVDWLTRALELGRAGERTLHTELYPQQRPLPCMKPRTR